MDPYQALADPVRRQIVELLARRHLPAGRVAEAFGHISRPAVSRHLRLLREAGLVNAERVGRERIFRADIEALDVIGAWIDGPTEVDQHLDAMATEFLHPP
ncbi:MAG: metalloregulator ArsR/SmtB family transcription factor [Acidimicrobiales bacterium]